MTLARLSVNETWAVEREVEDEGRFGLLGPCKWATGHKSDMSCVHEKIPGHQVVSNIAATER